MPTIDTLLPASVDHRYDFILLFDVINGNPNGDPDAGNSPRVDPETAQGLVSDVALKRKIRNYVALAQRNENGEPAPGYDIYVKERAVLNQLHAKAYEACGLDPKKKDASAQQQARQWMCQTFFDVRIFGAVMSTEINAGQVRGPLQLTFARSIDPIMPLEQAITRMAVTNERDADKERTMGRKEIVPYGLYVAYGFFSPQLAQQTGVSAEDLTLVWRALQEMFDFDRSAARGLMGTKGLKVFEHDSALGRARAHQLFERVQIGRRDASRPPRAFSDYTVTVDLENLPDGITLHELV